MTLIVLTEVRVAVCIQSLSNLYDIKTPPSPVVYLPLNHVPCIETLPTKLHARIVAAYRTLQ
jgi:hypothetical protein